MWTAKVEPMTETLIDDEERLWKVAVYEKDKLVRYQAEGLTYNEAGLIANNLQRKFDEK
jgi:hypothetical protein